MRLPCLSTTFHLHLVADVPPLFRLVIMKNASLIDERIHGWLKLYPVTDPYGFTLLTTPDTLFRSQLALVLEWSTTILVSGSKYYILLAILLLSNFCRSSSPERKARIRGSPCPCHGDIYAFADLLPGELNTL
jgi:hypothetical protein